MILRTSQPIPSALLRAGLVTAGLALLGAPAALAQQQQRTPAVGQKPSQPAAATQTRTAPGAKPAAPTGQTAKPAAKPATPTSAAQGTKPAPAGAGAAGAAAAGAAGAARPAAAAGPGGASAVLLADHGDWAVYTAQAGRSKICYALTQPKDRLPKTLNRDPAYLFVSFDPAQNVRNEIAFKMGFATKEDGPAEAAIGSTAFALLTKGTDAWLKNAAENGQAVAAMKRGQGLTVKLQSLRGNALTDVYSLNGFSQAVERAQKECP